MSENKPLWSEKSSSKQRRLHFLLTGHLSDCEILVIETDPDNPEKKYEKLFKLHKIILASASEVFEKLFFGDWREEKRIEIDDVSVAAFQTLLNYIYLNEFSVCGAIPLVRINELLYLGCKYMMQDFIDCVSKTLEQTRWSLHEILPIYEFACFYEELRLMMLSYKHVQDNASALLKHQTFYDLNVKNLKRLMVLLSSNRTLTHYQVVHAIDRYGAENGFDGIAGIAPESLEAYREVKNYVRVNGQMTDYNNLS